MDKNLFTGNLNDLNNKANNIINSFIKKNNQNISGNQSSNKQLNNLCNFHFNKKKREDSPIKTIILNGTKFKCSINVNA